MRSNLALIEHRMALNLEENGTDILLEWQDYASGPTIDPVTQSQLGTPTPQREIVKGFVHHVPAVAQTQVRQFAEIEVGDCLVDLHPDVVIEGRRGLTFTFDGRQWWPKALGDKLPQSWDAVVQGTRLYRTILLRR